MSFGDGQERTEEASPKRKQDARKEGRVAKSQDLVGALVTLALVGTMPGLITSLGQGALTAVRATFATMPTNDSAANFNRALANSLQPTLPPLIFLLCVPLTVGVFATVVQTGLLFSTKALTPDFKKIDPMSGTKRLFSSRSLMEGMKAFAKFLLFGYVAYGAVAPRVEEFGNLGQLPPADALMLVGETLRTVATRVGLVWLVLAGIDYAFQRKQNDKQLKMTKDEVKREMKDQEGSPEIKAARHQRRRKLMRQRVRDAVKTADVIVTNPTHFAVALRYNPSKDAAPIVVAKGVDLMAAKIREFAREDRIPIVPNPRLARALYRQCDVGDTIPKELFAAVAEVLAYVYRVLKGMRSGG